MDLFRERKVKREMLFMKRSTYKYLGFAGSPRHHRHDVLQATGACACSYLYS